MSNLSDDEYVAYFCHAKEDKNQVLNAVVRKLESKYEIKCAQYDRDFSRIGAYVTNLWREFFEKSKFIVVILSPDFLKSKEAMYQLHLATHYCYEEDVGKIIPIIYKKCVPPLMVKAFKAIDAAHKSWWGTFIERLGAPAKRYPREPICVHAEGHIDLSLVKPKVERKVMSQPINQNVVLTNHMYGTLKAHAKRQMGPMPFEIGLMEAGKFAPDKSPKDNCSFMEKQTEPQQRNSEGKDLAPIPVGQLDKVTTEDYVGQIRHQETADIQTLAASLERKLHPDNFTGRKRYSLDNDAKTDVKRKIDPRALLAGEHAVRRRRRVGFTGVRVEVHITPCRIDITVS